MAQAYPEVLPMKELRATLSQLRLFRLAVGQDGRNRVPLRPFASKTGRNQPSTAQFIFGPAAWLRGLIKPEAGSALAYVDYEQQEFGIAAALSGDPAMMAAYRSGDPYLAFAKQANAVPAGATKATHREERDKFKVCALAVQYGMQARSLAARLRTSAHEAQRLLRLHRATYPRYWAWSREISRVASRDGKLTATFGWTLHVGPGANPRSVRNWPLQANGAEMLRLACCLLTEAGVRVCAPVHDALLIDAPAEAIEEAVMTCRQVMQQASELVLPGFPLRTDAKTVQYPDRFMEPRGREMWARVFGLLGRQVNSRCA
jgi:DNA polymerase I-like protein with 3'-5' exonuclease and polymerase domains